MKNYITPVAELLLLANEDVLTKSDPFGADIFFETPTNGKTEG